MQQFSMPTTVYFGSNSKHALHRLQKPFIVADSFFATSPLMTELTNQFTDFTLFTDFTPDPTLNAVAKGVCAFRNAGSKSMLAVGGGSAIDTAKAILLFADVTPSVPLAVIPTTSGTGSEVTAFSVVTDNNTKTKHPLVSEKMLPSIAVLDTDFIKTVPQNLAAATGADALCHALESYVSKNQNPFADAFSEKAIQYLFKYLPLAVQGDLYAKEQVHFAATMAGIAFNATGLGLCHAMAHNIGAKFKIPHGCANSILLCPVIAFNAGPLSHGTACSETALRYAAISRILGNEGTPPVLVRKLIADIRRLFRTIQLPERFSVSKAEFDSAAQSICQGALKDSCLQDNPVMPTAAQIISLYEGVL